MKFRQMKQRYGARQLSYTCRASIMTFALVVSGVMLFLPKTAWAQSNDQTDGIDTQEMTTDEALRSLTDTKMGSDGISSVDAPGEVNAGADEASDAIPRVAAELRIPVENNDWVRKWINYFTRKDRERFQRFLDRGELYRDVVESVLEENDLPAELYYLAMIESGFQTHARSVAKAVGVWQFIPGTAERYGLRVEAQIDERRDPVRATEAAAKYLRDLHNVFGSWHLAMAAYNAGEIRVLRAIFKARTRDFWELVSSNALPSETSNYVPKFIAAVLIGQNPEKYGFSIDHNHEAYPELEAVEVPGGLRLSDLASVSGLSHSELKRVNPHLTRGSTPFDGKTYEVWVPKSAVAQVQKNQSRLVQLAKPKFLARGNHRSPGTIHIVRRGETLSLLARKYNVSIGHLKRINGLRSSRILIGMKLRTQSKSYAPSKTVRYKVRRGDNLTIIARKFNTTVTRIKKQNRLHRNRILIGQVLRIELPRM